METSNENLYFEIMKTFVVLNSSVFKKRSEDFFVNEKRAKLSQRQHLQKKRGSCGLHFQAFLFCTNKLQEYDV